MSTVTGHIQLDSTAGLTATISSTTDGIEKFVYLNITNISNKKAGYTLYYTDTDSSFDDTGNKVILKSGILQALDTIILNSDDIPGNGTLGGDAVDGILKLELGNYSAAIHASWVYEEVVATPTSVTKYFTPTSFVSSNYRYASEVDAGGGNVDVVSSSVTYMTQFVLPVGAKLTEVMVWASSADSMKVVGNSIANNSYTTLETGVANTAITLTESAAAAGKYVTVEFDPDNIADEIYGGYYIYTL